MKNKKFLISILSLIIYLLTLTPAAAEGDQNRQATNNPNQNLPPVQNQSPPDPENPTPSQAAANPTLSVTPPTNQYRNQEQVEIQNQDGAPQIQVQTHAGRSDTGNQYRNQEKLEVQNQGSSSQIQVQTQAGRSDTAGQYASRLQIRFNQYSQKMWVVAAKIQNSINQYAARGKNVSQAQAGLNQAKQQLSLADNQAKESIAAFYTIEPNAYQIQSQSAAGASGSTHAARTAYQTALRYMSQSINALKQSN